MSGKKTIISTTLLILFLISLSLFSDTFSFSADSMETVLAGGKERTVLSGNARVVSEDNNILADRIELFGDDFRYLRCKGRVSIVNKKRGLELTSQELFYNRDDKVVRANGNVIMIDKENEMVVKGGFLEDWEEREETLVQIGVRILKEDLVCRSEFARYLRAEDKLELSGMPVVTWKGDEYRALKIFIDLDNDTIRLEGDVQGKVSIEEEGEEPEEGGGQESGSQEEKPAESGTGEKGSMENGAGR